MNKICKIVTTVCFFVTTSCLGDCDFSKDVKKNSDGTYSYSEECHIEVGKSVKLNGLLNEKVSLLEKKIELKDLMITKYEERTQNWMDTATKLNDKIQSYESLSSSERWVSFSIGVGLTIASVWAAGQIIK